MLRTILRLILAVALCYGYGTAQLKVGEFAKTDSDSQAARLDDFLAELLKDPESKGLVIVYSGADLSRIGNLMTLISGIESWQNFRKVDSKRVSVVVAKGKEPFFQEHWLIRKGEGPPKFDPVDFRPGNITRPLLFALDCIACEPAVPGLSIESLKLSLIPQILKDNPQLNITAKIPWNANGRFYLSELRRHLETEKIDQRRVRINRIGKSDLHARIYLTPNTNQNH